MTTAFTTLRLPRRPELAEPAATLAVLSAVRQHPLQMSPVLLEYLLRGEVIGRMAEKGLLTSPFHGALASLPASQVTLAIAGALERGELLRATGFYPSLTLTPAGERRALASRLQPAPTPTMATTAPDANYAVYYKWRQAAARTMHKPPYRIVPNTLLVHLAALRPTSLDQLLGVPGLGKRRALRYQHELLALGRQLEAGNA